MAAILYNGFIVLVIWMAAWFAGWRRDNGQSVRLIISFSAGIFLGVCFLHMIPESAHLLGDKVGLFVLVGYLTLYLLERFIMVHPCEEDACDYHRVGLAAFFGLSLHSLINGLALGSSLLIPGLGFAVFFATLAHKGPESFSLTSLLILGHRSKAQVLTYLAVFSVMVPIGTVIALVGLEPFGQKVIGAAVAVSAGIFLQIATGDLLPEMHHSGGHRFAGLFLFLLGIGLAMAGHWIGG
ncbi:MAG TPA: ZIP family metal transporter [Bdellovibrionota bacterium]|nr:ZIP family metal transporter [Bdellovibrionota bacterium]